MGIIIDRRKNGNGKSTANRQKFLKRIEGQVKENMSKILEGESILDQTKDGSIKVPIRGLKEPSFKINPQSGNKKNVRPGNDKFTEGDKIEKPPQGEGQQGRKGSDSDETSEDDFVVQISREEFLDYFFDDLELPNLLQKEFQKIEEKRMNRAGFVRYGNPSRLNIKRSYHEALSRQLAIQGVLKKKIKKLESQLSGINIVSEKQEVENEIQKLKRQIASIAFMDEVDLRYQNFEPEIVPINSAVMFCIMDVSASMTQHEKNISKRFFMLLYLFLNKQYKKLDIVFIRHHTEAKEVSEDEFFNSRESGGTKVLPALELMNQIIQERYDPNAWNIYGCQASDGDVWSMRDAEESHAFLKNNIINNVQYMAYLEINPRERDSDLWVAYQSLVNDTSFAARKLYDQKEIWPIFEGLFKKRNISVK